LIKNEKVRLTKKNNNEKAPLEYVIKKILGQCYLVNAIDFLFQFNFDRPFRSFISLMTES